MRLCYGVLVLMILCKQNSAPLRVAKQKWEGGRRRHEPRPFEGYGTISGTFAVKGLFAKARKRLLCSMSDYL